MRAILSVMSAAVLALGLVSAPAAAQEITPTPTTPENVTMTNVTETDDGGEVVQLTPVTNDASESVPTIRPNTTEQPSNGSVGPVEIQRYAVQNGRMLVTVQTSTPVPYALSDALAGLRASGVTQIPMKRGVLESGRRTLSLSITTVDGAAAVTLSVPGDAVRIQSGTVAAGRPAVPYTTALLAILGAGIGAGYLSYRRAAEALSDDDEPEVSRIA